jgi:hypothetical protein
MLWSNYCGKNYHMFLCVAILMKKRSDIINNQMEFDDILKVFCLYIIGCA